MLGAGPALADSPFLEPLSERRISSDLGEFVPERGNPVGELVATQYKSPTGSFTVYRTAQGATAAVSWLASQFPPLHLFVAVDAWRTDEGSPLALHSFSKRTPDYLVESIAYPGMFQGRIVDLRLVPMQSTRERVASFTNTRLRRLALKTARQY